MGSEANAAHERRFLALGVQILLTAAGGLMLGGVLRLTVQLIPPLNPAGSAWAWAITAAIALLGVIGITVAVRPLFREGAQIMREYYAANGVPPFEWRRLLRGPAGQMLAGAVLIAVGMAVVLPSAQTAVFALAAGFVTITLMRLVAGIAAAVR